MFNLRKKSSHNVPIGTEDIVPLSSIKIPHNFVVTNPAHHKIISKLNDYHTHDKTLKDPVTVIPLYNTEGKPNGYYSLKDNYIGYIILLFNNVQNVPVKFYTDIVLSE